MVVDVHQCRLAREIERTVVYPKDAPVELQWEKAQCKNDQLDQKYVPCGSDDVKQVSLGQLQGELSDQKDDILQVHSPHKDV